VRHGRDPSDPSRRARDAGLSHRPDLAAHLAQTGERLAPGTAGRPFSNMLCFSVYAAQLAFNRLYKQILAPHGLTYLQYLVLVALAEAQERGVDRTVGELGEALFLESNTLTPLLKRMEAAGLVARRRDPRDERVVRVTLAEAGAGLVRRSIACRSMFWRPSTCRSRDW
jgi:DNA-binding MarR family transcriptional regulator